MCSNFRVNETTGATDDKEYLVLAGAREKCSADRRTKPRNLQHAAGINVSDILNFAAGACGSSLKSANLTFQRRGSSSKPSSAAVMTQLAEQDDINSCCEVLTPENQCIPELDAEVDELREQLADG